MTSEPQTQLTLAGILYDSGVSSSVMCTHSLIRISDGL